ncbi:SDR family oxidoreductase [Alphaproteobacteria bacterium]|nr:SDR family oxidoreductase [Alphaproteobacteria bacterium]
MKIALITGGGSGIGRAAALELNKINYLVYVVGRRNKELEETSSLKTDKSLDIIPVSVDITNGNEVILLFKKIKNDHGRIDLLFNNAGMGAPRVPIDELKEADWRNTVDVNLTGSFLCAQQAIKLMKIQNPQGGRIINNGSVSAHSPRPDTVAYTATKHAINGLTKSIALDGRNFNISCSQLDIGNADTAIGSRFKTGVPQANGQNMIEPVFEAEDCGKAIAYIASLPLGTNILNMTIMATNMPFVGRG